MWRKPWVVVLFFVIAIALWLVFDALRLPSGLEPKGPENWVPWVALAGSLISLITGIITLTLKIIELKYPKKA